MNAGVIVAYSLVDGVGARLSGNAFSYTAWVCMISGILFLFLSVGFFGVRVNRHFVGQWKKGIIGGGCSLVSYSLALWAMTQAPIASVAALRETSILFGTLLAVFFFKGKDQPPPICVHLHGLHRRHCYQSFLNPLDQSISMGLVIMSMMHGRLGQACRLHNADSHKGIDPKKNGSSAGPNNHSTRLKKACPRKRGDLRKQKFSVNTPASTNFPRLE